MSRAFPRGPRSPAQEQRLQPPHGLPGAGESRAGGGHKEAGPRPDVAGIQDPWRTHLAIHRLRHSSGRQRPPLPKAGPPSSQRPEEDPGQEPQGEASGPRAAPAPGSAPPARAKSHYPFPKRKAPRISEAARRLGLYRPT
ncbi:translation initiation factor IF-2-like [Antechinus flavipes]|uniref:translation initiation factor IF-2-like n=1 Tax=Antechinus flavipes TaxID=38775 RepID=UPI00223642A7|nr:translation initiation factor IF-2-like [Antechinus flavipes]